MRDFFYKNNMHIFFTSDIDSKASVYTLNEEESKHAVRVLRMKNGDTINLIDGVGGFYLAELTDDNPKRCSVKILEFKSDFGKRNWNLHIAIAPTKLNDRIEWFAEKATEIGIDRISFINCKNSERTVIKTERVSKIVVSAIKQSVKAYLPQIDEIIDFKKFIDSVKNESSQKFIAHCDKNFELDKKHLKNVYSKNDNVILLIGPEGDFTKQEIEYAIANGFIGISLGEARLRTETAAVYACTVLNSINE